MVGPGNDDAVAQFLEELEQQDAPIADAEQQQQDEPAAEDPGEQLLAGKFKSAADLEKAYKELERKLGQRGQQTEPEPQPLTREQAVGYYGESIVAAAEESGIDLGAWDQAVKAGGDTKEMREKLAAQTGIPAQLIEQYEAAFRPQANPPAIPDGSGLTDADVSELKGLVGGEQEFARLSQWAAANMAAEELADYNAAVDSGNKAAVRLALRAMQARSTTSATPAGEPELISGGRPARVEVFASQQEALEAMRKENSQGKRLYNTDPKYKAWFEKTLARSNFPS